MPRRFILGLVALAFLPAFRYGWAVRIEFINDDFLFLERARTASFLENWSFEDALGNFYRPLSRNLYFWIGQHLFGREPAPYHLVNLGLFALGLVLTALVARRILRTGLGLNQEWSAAGGLTAALLFALHPATGPLASWVCGAQDLLAIDSALAAALAHLAGRRLLYPLLYLAALLSKETAVLLFVPLAFWDLTIGRAGLRRALARQLPVIALLAVWAVVNPWLPWNELGRTARAGGPGSTHFHLETLAFTFRMLFLLEPTESFRWPYGPLATAGQLILSALILVLAGPLAAGHPRRAGAPMGHRRQAVNVAIFAALWSLSGILPLAAVHEAFVYYASYPALGLSLLASLVTILILARARDTRTRLLAWLLPGAAALALTIGAGLIHHPSLADAHNIRRASAYLESFRADLERLRPAFPESSLVYFWNIPYWIGFQSADGPALRVWYGDPTLSGRFLSTYAPEPGRPTFFFGHDDSMRLIEIVRGLPDPALADPPPIYTAAHNDLGAAFSAAGEPEAAAVEWRKVLQVDANFVDAAANLGRVLVDLGRAAEAVPVLEHAGRLEPGAADVTLDLGRAYLDLGRRREALATLERFLHLHPGAPERERVRAVVEKLREEELTDRSRRR